MARHTGPRMVQCYLCRHRFEVGGRAQSTSCPGCNKPVIVGDLILKGSTLKGPKKEERTCGKIVVGKKARLMAEFVEAHGGIECEGTIEARHVLTSRLVLGAKAVYKGDLQAQTVEMKPGAKVKPSQFAVPEDPIGLADLPQSGSG